MVWPGDMGRAASLLDTILADAAVECGVELAQGFNVEDHLDGDRLAGIRGRSAGGDLVQEQATITVGADGRNSGLAKAVHAAVYDSTPTLLCYYFSYWSDVQRFDPTSKGTS